MGKILSVCVPSYNMEKYLNRCIDTFLVPEVIDQLEIIIVNDGSTDGTLAIANEYKEKYPQSIVVIDKPNGHYGSCVNASLKVATGKYFRIVDADDWVDSNALVQFVEALEKFDVDCVCTKRTLHNFNDNTVTSDDSKGITFQGCLDLNKDHFPIQYLRMHNLTYSMSLLRRIHYTQTEGVCYTDTEYSYTPLSYAQKVAFVDVSLYQYFVGRGDQSMSQEVLKKNVTHLTTVIQSIQRVHQGDCQFNNNEEVIWSTLLARLLYLVLPVYLLHYKKNKEVDSVLRNAIYSVQESNLTSLSGVISNRFMGIPYVANWYQNKIVQNSLLPVLVFIRKLFRS